MYIEGHVSVITVPEIIVIPKILDEKDKYFCIVDIQPNNKIIIDINHIVDITV